MKTLKFIPFFLSILIITLFSSCSDDDDENQTLVTIDFEDITLSEAGYINNIKYESKDLTFNNNFNEEYNSWDGFSYSSLTDKITAGFDNQYSVYANSGAANSKKFAVAYNGFSEKINFKFPAGKAHTLKSVMLNNSTYAALSLKEGDGYGKKFEAGDWFKVIFTGYNAAGEKENTYEFYLADFRSGKSYICEQWTEVNLSSLGKVNKIEITFESTDNDSIYGMKTPAYVCLDNLVYILEE